ncbi:hypothetical protein BDC45DRAFT_493260 [Circinella umbellata]|nr:hypothetical protein BDC45DRAFT_493260 [Circinella umbellata]
MKFSTTLSLIIGSFFAAVNGQSISADIRYEMSIAGGSTAYYALACNEPGLFLNHPMATEACQELEEYAYQAQTIKQPLSVILGNALNPSQPIQNPTPCNVIGQEVTLKFIFGEINGEVVIVPNDPKFSRLIYTNGCDMRMIAEQTKLSSLLSFYKTESIPTLPLQ